MKKLIYILMVLVLLVPACDKTAKDAQFLVERGKVLLDAGYPQDALELYRKASLKDSNCADAYLQTAILYDEYLNDQPKAIIAYEKFLSISESPVMRKRVQTWLLEIRKGKEDKAEQNNKESLKIADVDLQSELSQRDDQFKMLREQLVERYEAKLEVLNQKNLEDNEKVIALENENNVLRSDSSKKEILNFVDTISSNKILVANLEAKLEEEKQENKTAFKSLEILQNMVADLQNKSLNNLEDLSPVSTILETNTILAAEVEILSLKLKTLETEKNKLEQNLLSNQKPSLIETSETYSSSKFESLIAATNKILKLEKKIQFHNQAKENLITDLFKTRKVYESKNKQLEGLNKKYIQAQKSLVNYKLTKSQLEEEKKKTANWKKLLYDRTVSLNKIKQQYNSLYKRYQVELNKNKKINEKISSIQSDLSTFDMVDKSPKKIKATRSKSYRTRTYTVKRGDSLATIARRLYGDSKKWELIFNANRDVLNRPNQLRIGQILKIP